jgi:hypothetical protein
LLIGSIGYSQSESDINPNILKRIGAKPFPLKFTGGMGMGGRTDGYYGYNKPILQFMFTTSYAFSKGIKYKSFTLYPEIVLGVLEANKESASNHEFADPDSYHIIYGMIEGHRRWKMEELNGSFFFGTGIGGYTHRQERGREDGSCCDSPTNKGGGLILSSGVRLNNQRLTGGISVYRIPQPTLGLGKLVTNVNVGYQPKNFKEATIAAVVLGILYIPLMLYLIQY